jgi:hypothetical protein
MDISPFTSMARAAGIHVSVISWEELERACEAKPPITLPVLPKSAYKDLIYGVGEARTFKEILPKETHDFIDHCFGGIHLRRISDEDAQIFLDKTNKGPRSEAEIRKLVPEKYHHLIEAFLPAEADKLPPHRQYDHKIEMIPGAPIPFSRSRPVSPMELTVVKAWLDANLRKGFVRAS